MSCLRGTLASYQGSEQGVYPNVSENSGAATTTDVNYNFARVNTVPGANIPTNAYLVFETNVCGAAYGNSTTYTTPTNGVFLIQATVAYKSGGLARLAVEVSGVNLYFFEQQMGTTNDSVSFSFPVKTKIGTDIKIKNLGGTFDMVSQSTTSIANSWTITYIAPFV